MPKPSKPLIIGLVQSELSSYFKVKDLKLEKLDISTANYSIIGYPDFKIEIDEENGYNVSKIPVKISDDKYWVSLVISLFNNAAKHVSIAFYDVNDKKLFRAEWTKNEDNTKHAQPHWHIHYTKPTLDPEEWNQDDKEFFEGAFSIPDKDKFANIHFAMSAMWHEVGRGHVQSFPPATPEELISWIIGVIDYSIHQLTYLHDKRLVGDL